MAPPCSGQARTQCQFLSRLCASRKLCYGNYTLRLFFIGCHRQRQRQLRWLPTLLLLIRSQRSSGQLLRIASRMKTDIDDRLNPQAPPPVPLHMAGLLKNFIWNETLKITARKAITAQRTTFSLPLAPFPRSAHRAIHFQLNWNACFLTTTFATYYTIAHFPFPLCHDSPSCPVAQLSWSSSVGPAVSFSTICSHISPATCRNHPRCRIRTQLVVVVVVVIRARVTQNKAIFLQNMDILGLWICWKIKMAATSQCVWEKQRMGEREWDLFALQQSQGVSCTPIPRPSPLWNGRIVCGTVG